MEESEEIIEEKEIIYYSPFFGLPFPALGFGTALCTVYFLFGILLVIC